MKVISSKICPFVQRVAAALEVKKISYEIAYISLKDKPQWFLDISPNAQVPVLITDTGAALFESDAIVEYLDDFYKPLEDALSAEQKALDRAWSYLASKNYLLQCASMRSADKDTFQERIEKLNKVFAKAENKIEAGPYFKGRALSKVDIAWLPLLHRAAVIETHTSYDFLLDYPKVKRWQAAMSETGLFQKSVANDFEIAFAEFYLPESTYLGAMKAASVI